MVDRLTLRITFNQTNNIIEAIKAVRAVTYFGLKEAKDAVESIVAFNSDNVRNIPQNAFVLVSVQTASMFSQLLDSIGTGIMYRDRDRDSLFGPKTVIRDVVIETNTPKVWGL